MDCGSVVAITYSQLGRRDEGAGAAMKVPNLIQRGRSCGVEVGVGVHDGSVWMSKVWQGGGM